MARFFAVSLPGLEDLVEDEIKSRFPEFTVESVPGGVNVDASLADGLGMNLALKTPTRILLRAAEFTCRDFPKLFKKVSGLDWSEWIDPASTLEVSASSHRSRLKIKSRLEETCLDGWKAYQKAKGVKTDPRKKANLFVRLNENLCTLSLDTTGERLHKRGQREFIGEAPLRESIAAAMLRMLAHADPLKNGEPIELVDPMVGSGTFLIEALTRDWPNEGRAFQQFKIEASIPKMTAQEPRFQSGVGFEADKKTLTAARGNLEGLKVQLILGDFFLAEKLSAGPRRWIIANPPYGERLKVDEPLDRFYAKLFAACEKVVRPELAAFLLPAKSGRLELPPSWKVAEKRRFTNGGIPVIAYIFKRN